jgi:uncharacterized protein YjbJ (UPF0337 family)
MTEQQIRGRFHQFSGMLIEFAGFVIGSAQLRVEGQTRRIVGRAQQRLVTPNEAPELALKSTTFPFEQSG